LLWSVLWLFTGCVADVGKDHVAAKVEEAPAVAPAAPAAGGKVLQVDRSRASLHALGAKVTAQEPIDFPDFTGSVTLDGDVPTAVAFDATLGTLVARVDRLTEHLKTEDFFYVEKYPHATFASTAITPGGTGGTHTVTGDLTIRGQTKRVTFPATFTLTPAEVSANAEFVINRQDFGITYPGKADDLVQDNVVLTVKFVAPRT
jgi:polyisoprenoid-binding protein YceI